MFVWFFSGCDKSFGWNQLHFHYLGESYQNVQLTSLLFALQSILEAVCWKQLGKKNNLVLEQKGSGFSLGFPRVACWERWWKLRSIAGCNLGVSKRWARFTQMLLSPVALWQFCGHNFKCSENWEGEMLFPKMEAGKMKGEHLDPGFRYSKAADCSEVCLYFCGSLLAFEGKSFLISRNTGGILVSVFCSHSCCSVVISHSCYSLCTPWW